MLMGIRHFITVVKKITRSAIVEHSAALMYRLVEEIEATRASALVRRGEGPRAGADET
jgi:hypothetical protein